MTGRDLVYRLTELPDGAVPVVELPNGDFAEIVGAETRVVNGHERIVIAFGGKVEQRKLDA
jgi:hypothetical protein